MKKILLLSTFFVSSFGFSQVTLLEDSFDTYGDFLITGFGQWQTLDLDLLSTYTGGTTTPTWPNAHAPQAFQIFNPSAAMVTNATNGVGGETESRNFDPRTGLKYAASWAGEPNSNGQTGTTANNDWLISPPINLAGASGSSLSIWVKSLSNTYGLEKYRIGVYVGSGSPTGESDFTILHLGELTAPFPNWAERTQSLAAYDGQTIRIGIQNKTADAYMFMVDDFKVTAATLAVSDFVSSKLSVYPIPANNVVTVTNNDNIQIAKVVFTDINGRTVKILNLNGVTESQINISDLNAGVYFMNIDTSEGTATKKIVKS